MQGGMGGEKICIGNKKGKVNTICRSCDYLSI